MTPSALLQGRTGRSRTGRSRGGLARRSMRRSTDGAASWSSAQPRPGRRRPDDAAVAGRDSRHPPRGRPRTHRDRVLADKAYSSRAIRAHLRERGRRGHPRTQHPDRQLPPPRSDRRTTRCIRQDHLQRQTRHRARVRHHRNERGPATRYEHATVYRGAVLLAATCPGSPTRLQFRRHASWSRRGSFLLILIGQPSRSSDLAASCHTAWFRRPSDGVGRASHFALDRLRWAVDEPLRRLL